MDLSGWTYLFEFGHGLYVYTLGAVRVAVDKDNEPICYFKGGPDNSPRCKDRLETRACNDTA